jgi:hypothetical protein
MRYTLERPRVNQYPTERIIAELRRIASLYGKRHFSRREFDEKATDCKGSVVLSRFGSWQAALDAAGLKLEKIKKDRSQISNDQLFEELGRIWHLLGHRPSKDEWEKVGGKYSYTTYKTRFKGWVNACSAFIENVSSRNEGLYTQPQAQVNVSLGSETKLEIPTEEKRNIPMKLRYRVLTKDNYKCVLCGRSPAIHASVSLHIDHIVAFSQGGKTVFENLRTLCSECNWGKGSAV